MAQSVGQLLSSAQDSAAACERCAGALWKLALQDPDGTFSSLQQCVDYLVTLGQKSTYVERSIRFFGVFASKAPADSEAAAALLEELLQHLATRLACLDKAVRHRSAQLLQLLLAGLPEGLLLEESVVAALRAALTERLHDKLPAVRAAAARAICHLVTPDNDEEDEAVVQAVLGLLDSDKSRDVRIAVVTSLPLAPSTLPLLLERLRDVSPLVRKALVLRLKNMSVRLLSIKQRAEVIQLVLRDRDIQVTDAASKLLAHWLQQDCQGDPLQLLQLLDVETYTEAAVLAIESLISSGSIRPKGSSGAASSGGHRAASSRDGSASVIAYVEAALESEDDGSGGSGSCLTGLRQLAEQQTRRRLLQPHEALMWRCLCEWLRTDAIGKGLAAAATGGARAAVQAAVAAERHEVLERVLPESAAEVMQLVMSHAAAGPPARFAGSQLLMIAASCVDWTDAASRAMAAPYLQQLIASNPTALAEHEQAAAVGGGSDSDDEMAAGFSGDRATVSAGLQLAGNGGDGLFEASVVQLVLAVQGVAGPGFAGTVMDGVAGLAAAAGLLGKPQEDGSVRFSVAAAEPSTVLQALAYICLMLQQLPSCQQLEAYEEDGGSCFDSALSFSSLWELLLLLALKQDHPDIRAKAVEGIALYALAASGSNPGLLSSAVQLLGPLAAAGGCSAVRQAAVHGLVDVALLFGPAAVDCVLRAPAAPARVDSGADNEADDGQEQQQIGGSAGEGLLGLLLGQAEELLAELQAPNAAKTAKRGGRSGVAAKVAPAALSTASAELLAAVAESLCKLLLHQRAWLGRYRSCPVTPLAMPAALAASAAAADAEQAEAADAAATTPVPAAAGSASRGISSSCTISLPPDSRQLQARLLRNALSLLLQLQFHPATEQALQLRQGLSLFFDVFAAAGADFRLQLVAACLPAAHSALHVTCKKNPAALLVKLVLQLLQATGQKQQQGAATAGDGQHQHQQTLLGESNELLAQQLLWEVEVAAAITVNRGLQPAKYKPYLSALLKVVCELPLQPGESDLAALQALTDRLSASITDATLKKEVAAVQQLLQQLASAAGVQEEQAQQLTAQQVELLVQHFTELSVQQQLAPLPPEAAGGAAATPAAPRTTSRKAAATTATRKAPGAGGAAASAARRRSTRPSSAAAAAVAARASSSDDDSASSGRSTGSSDSDEDEGDSSSSSDDEGAVGGGGRDAAPAGKGTRRGSAAAAATRQPLGPSSIVNSRQEC